MVAALAVGDTVAAAATAEKAQRWPSGARWRSAIEAALRDPGTWVPAAGAAVFLVDDFDERLSSWAVERTPVFGSPQSANDWSDGLEGAAYLGMLSTSLAARPGDGPWESRLERVGLQHASVLVADLLTSGLKDLVERERPQGSGERSFPSGHATRAFNFAASARANLDHMQLGPESRAGLAVGLTAIAAGTAWARIEAGKHFPSDVLVGAAIGNLVARFFDEAFAGRDDAFALRVQLERRGLSVHWTVRTPVPSTVSRGRSRGAS